MIPAKLISKKRDGEFLSKDELNTFFNGYLANTVTDAQMSAMLMAIYFNGMNDEEIFSLVEVMLFSGSRIEFSDSKKYIADKHSTGGVGDKVSIILAPIMAAAGINIPMIAGRGLGFTGGTIDKLESIPGFNTSADVHLFKKWVNKGGYAIISQSDQICTADKRIYALRSKTGTVPSIPLICGSIMSKKIAEGISGLVLDIKVGNGTFMKTKKQAIELGTWMKKIGKSFNIKTDIVYTNMNQPLGRYGGLSCEIEESIKCLKGNGPKDLMNVVLTLGTKMLIQAGLAKNESEANKIQTKIINSGEGLALFKSATKMQGGILDKFNSQKKPKYENLIFVNNEGIIQSMDTESIGWALVKLDCVMHNKNNNLDYTAGIEFLKKVGEEVKNSEPVFRVFGSNKKKLNSITKKLQSAIELGKNYKKISLIL